MNDMTYGKIVGLMVGVKVGELDGLTVGVIVLWKE